MAAEEQFAVTAPRERGWRGLVLALAGVAALSAVSAWPPSLALFGVAVRWALPLAGIGGLVLAGLAACAVAAWARGGRIAPAAVAVLGTAAWLWWSEPGDAVSRFAVGWTLLSSAAFGWWAMAGGERPFLGRALSAVALAGLVAVSLLVWGQSGPVPGVTRLGVAFEQSFEQERARGLAAWQSRLSEPGWARVSARVPAARELADRAAAGVASLAPPTAILPALLVLETLLALALSWALWHRVSRARLGPPLSALSQFRFNDQLVWGLVAGATLVLLPSLSGWRDAGVNLVVMFGALHAVRGIGVLVWWVPDRWALVPLLLLLVSIPLLGPVQVLATVAVLALGLGLGDTWRDFRRTTRSLRPNARP